MTGFDERGRAHDRHAVDVAEVPESRALVLDAVLQAHDRDVGGRGGGFHLHVEYCTSRWRAGGEFIGDVDPIRADVDLSLDVLSYTMLETGSLGHGVSVVHHVAKEVLSAADQVRTAIEVVGSLPF